MRPILTAAIWAISIGCLLVAGGIAVLFAMMPVSLDIGEMINAGAEPWRDAAIAVAAFVGFALASALSLRLWHGMRFRALAWTIALAEAALAAWSSAVVMREYF